MASIELLAILIGILLIAGVSKRLHDTIITLPMLYTLFGLLVGYLFTDRLSLSVEDPVVHIIAELTLVFVLATDASRIKFKSLFRYHNLPLRLLGIGLPLTIVLGAVVAIILFGQLGIWGAVILAVILAPTDASLGQSVVENPRVPARIRQALNIESGLNDGIAMPFLLLAVSLEVSSEFHLGSGIFLRLVAAQISFGLLVGIVMGYLSARYIYWGLKSGWMSSGFQKICWLALALLTYGLAKFIGGNGFIAAFIFGFTSSNAISQEESELRRGRKYLVDVGDLHALRHGAFASGAQGF
ncbi:MAG: cation:proton antiporter [Anaerolineae bacterium]|nr:cation:proton antiporter [Anaerolineae bacterium]